MRDKLSRMTRRVERPLTSTRDSLPHSNHHVVHRTHRARPDLFNQPPPALASKAGVEPSLYLTGRFPFRRVFTVAALDTLALALSPKSAQPVAYQRGVGIITNLPTFANLLRDYTTSESTGSYVAWSSNPPYDADLAPINVGGTESGSEQYQFAGAVMDIAIKPTYTASANVSIVDGIVARSTMNPLSGALNDGGIDAAETQHYTFVTEDALDLTELSGRGKVQVVVGGTGETAHVHCTGYDNSPGDWYRMPTNVVPTDALLDSDTAGGYPVGNLRNCMATGQQVVLIEAVTASVSVVVEGYVLLHLNTNSNHLLARDVSAQPVPQTPESSRVTSEGIAAGIGKSTQEAVTNAENKVIAHLTSRGGDPSHLVAASRMPYNPPEAMDSQLFPTGHMAGNIPSSIVRNIAPYAAGAAVAATAAAIAYKAMTPEEKRMAREDAKNAMKGVSGLTDVAGLGGDIASGSVKFIRNFAETAGNTPDFLAGKASQLWSKLF